MVKSQIPLKVFALLVTLALVISACNFPGFAGQADEENVDRPGTETAISQTLDAMNATTASPVDEPPTATVTSVIQTTTPQRLPDITQPAPTIKADVDTNCRMGPSKDYPVMGYLLVGQQSTVHGRNNDPGRQWWFIENPKKAGNYCWVWGETTRVEGDTGLLPIITPPPPPTPTATSAPELQVFYSNIHDCVGVPIATFQVVNDSDTTIQSTVMTLTDLDGNLPLYGPDISNSPFMAASNGCPPGGNTLPPGSSAYLGGPMGLALTGHTVQADIELCTLPGQGGECTTFTIQFSIP